MLWKLSVFLFTLYVLMPSAHASVSSAWQAPFLNLPMPSSEWTTTHPAPDRILFENRVRNEAVLIVEIGSSLNEIEAQLYLQKHFSSEAKRSREQSLNLDGSLITNFETSIGALAGRTYGATSFILPSATGDSYFSERAWVEDGRTWQIAIASWTSSAPNFGDLNSLADKLMKAIIARDHPVAQSSRGTGNREPASAELGGSPNARFVSPPKTEIRAQPLFPNPIERECSSLNIAEANRGTPPFELKIQQGSFASCLVGGKDAAKKWMNGVTSAFISGVTSLSKHSEENLRKHPCPQPSQPDGAFAWITYSAELHSYNSCLQMAGSMAVIQTSRDFVVETAHGLAALVNYVRTIKDPVSLVTALVQKEVKGFKCLSANAQMETVCEVLTHISGTLAATALTAGTAAALTAGSEVTLAARGALALRAGLLAARELVLSPVKIPWKAGQSAWRIVKKIDTAAVANVSKIAALRAGARAIREAGESDVLFQELAAYSGNLDSFEVLMTEGKTLTPEDLRLLNGRIEAANKKLTEIRAAYASSLSQTVADQARVSTLIANAEAKGIARTRIESTIREGLLCK